MRLSRAYCRPFFIAASLTVAASVPPQIGWAAPQLAASRLDPKQGTDFIVSLAKDASGNVWFGTEDAGIWRRDAAGTWKQYTKKDGLGDDNAYCITVDRQNRVWVGHLNHGVSVFNGQKWQNYSVLDGPLGERVFAIATSPVDGDVWMATNAGLSRYQVKTDSWKHYTQASGLPSNQLSALSIDSAGNVYVGTQCEGLGIGHMEGDYRDWDIVRRDHDTGEDVYPNAPAGEGLPSNLINDVLIADDDTIYVATTCGLARSKDFGATWSYIRGADWEAKLQGLYKPQTPIQPAQNLNRELLREDYVTNLAEDEKGLLWIGYRQKGYEVRRPLPDRTAFVSAQNDDAQFPYVSTLLPMNDGTALIASYGDGLSQSTTVPAYTPNAAEREELETRRGWKTVSVPKTISRLPSVAKPPTAAQFKTMIHEVEGVPASTNTKNPLVVPLADDWITQGDWQGRYGRYWMLGCAMLSPYDYVWGAGAEHVDYSLSMSPLQEGNHLRYWVHWLTTSNPRVLEMPPAYADSRVQKGLAKVGELRRQSEVDDNGEDYPMTKEGPDVYASLKIPAGLYTLSFYNHNKDGHDGSNRMRDYRVSVRSHPATVPLGEVKDFEKWPELARSRQRDFWGGVYQKFLIRGPQILTVQYNRNNSFNTILAGAFLDEVNEEPKPYFTGRAEDLGSVEPQMPDSALASQLWNDLERLKVSNPEWLETEGRRFYAPLVLWYEAARLHTTGPGLPRVYARLGAGYKSMNLDEDWEAMQRARGLHPARDIEKAITWDGKSAYNGWGRGAVLSVLSSEKFRLAQTDDASHDSQPPKQINLPKTTQTIAHPPG